jgi:PAS domain S-box-containing protein
MLGYTSDEWLKEPPGFGLRLVPEEDRERVRRESDEATATGKEAVSEFRWVTKDGRVRWVENYIAPIVDGKALSVCGGVALDVTERKAAEQALRESESFNHTILSSLNTHVCVLDRDGRIISVNQAWSDSRLIMGWPQMRRSGLA